MLLAWGGGGSGGRRKCQFMEILWISSTVILLSEEEPGQARPIVGRIACVGSDSIIWTIKKMNQVKSLFMPVNQAKAFLFGHWSGHWVTTCTLLIPRQSTSFYIDAFMLTYENGVWRGEMGQSCTLGFIFRIQGVKAQPFCASTQARGGGTLYNDLYDEALPESTFFTSPPKIPCSTLQF